MDKFNIESIIRELNLIKKGSWRIFDKPKINQIIFYLTKTPTKSKRISFDRYQISLAKSDREIAEIVMRRFNTLEYSDLVMIKLLE